MLKNTLRTLVRSVFDKMKKKLNLGCGNDYKEGWVNLENKGEYIDRKYKADKFHDLNKYPYPFKSNEFDLILASHLVEHLEDPLRFFKECRRILSANGELTVVVPHYTNPMAYTPLHKTYWSYKSMRHAANGLRLKEVKLKFTPKYKLIELIAGKFPVFYENTPLSIFPAKEIEAVYCK
ncbi:class I SAM-dependent methyltransferase [Candidatus Woesearchaeota archaeon]|nr:class I SAM-dependent methyltransferase [Candidatus Woesearchaeota archaeon]